MNSVSGFHEMKTAGTMLWKTVGWKCRMAMVDMVGATKLTGITDCDYYIRKKAQFAFTQQRFIPSWTSNFEADIVCLREEEILIEKGTSSNCIGYCNAFYFELEMNKQFICKCFGRLYWSLNGPELSSNWRTFCRREPNVPYYIAYIMVLWLFHRLCAWDVLLVISNCVARFFLEMFDVAVVGATTNSILLLSP